MWYLYVLRCKDDSFYTGITTDLARRLKEHRAGRGSNYTRAHLPVSLIAAWEFPDRSAATRAEYKFKSLQHFAKAAWAAGRWSFLEAPFAFEALASATKAADGLPHHFCPRCGAPLTLRALDADGNGGEKIPVCTLCGRIHFANAKPCAGALVVREGAVLLIRRTQAPFLGAWDIPGGFLNVDETPEAAVIREVREEANVEIRLLDFLGFYLDAYRFQDETSTTLNIYFVAETEDAPSAGAEADAWRWFPIEALPERIAFEHAPQVLSDLQTWIAGQEVKT